MIRQFMHSVMFAFLTSVAMLGNAQDDLDFSEMSLEDLLNVEVTSSSLREQSAKEAPNQIRKVVRREIDDSPKETIEEILTYYLPGFTLPKSSQDTFINRISIDGFRSAEYMLFNIDGVNVNMPHVGDTEGFMGLITTFSDGFEITSGPSTLSGTGAMLGAINSSTISGETWVQLDAGSFGERKVAAAFSHEFGNLVLDIHGSEHKSDGETFNTVDAHGFDRDYTEPFNRNYYGLKLSGENWTVQTWEAENRLDDGLLFSFVSQGVNTRNTSHRVFKADHTLNFESGSWRNEAYHITTDWNSIGDFIPEPISSAIGLRFPARFGPIAQMKRMEISSHFLYEMPDYFTFNAGILVQRSGDYWNANWGNTDPATLGDISTTIQSEDGSLGHFYSEFVDNLRRNTHSAYLQTEWKPNGKFIGTASLRHDRYSDVGGETNYRLATIYKPNDGNTFKGIILTGLVAPPPGKQSLKNNPIILGNPDLIPETIRTMQLIWIKEIEKGYMNLEVFQHTVNDQIFEAPSPDPRAIQWFANRSDTVVTEGAKLEFRFRDKWFDAMFIGTNISGDLDEFSPGNMAVLKIGYKSPRISSYIHARYQEGVEALPEQGSFLLADLTFNWRFNDRFNIKATLDNMLDRIVFYPDVSIPSGVEGSGRSVSISSTMKFN